MLMRILLAPHNETQQRGLKSKNRVRSVEFADTLTRKGKLDSLKPLCSICLNCLFNFEKIVFDIQSLQRTKGRISNETLVAWLHGFVQSDSPILDSHCVDLKPRRRY